MYKAQNKKQYYDNYCLQLLSGKFESVKLEDGRVIRVFTPQRTNKYPPLSQLVRGRMLQDTNISKQQILENEGFILPALETHKEVFIKTKSEKEASKAIKSAYKKALAAKSEPFMAQRAEMIKTIINPSRLPNWGAGGFVDILM